MKLVRNFTKLTKRERDGRTGREWGTNTFVDYFTGERFHYPHRDLSIACRAQPGASFLALMVPDMWVQLDDAT